jgi:hypothetical protein
MSPDLPGRKKSKNPDDGDAKKDKEKPYWKAVRIAAFFGILEAFSLVLWSKSEDFNPESARYIRWLAACGFLSGGAFLAHKLTGGKFKKRIICGIWFLWAIVCFVLFLTIPKEPKVDFVISLRFEEPNRHSDFKLFLTNDLLMERHLIDKGKLSDGGEWLQSIVPGCLVIPVKNGESNKVFRFNVENDAPFKITDLQVCVGFPLGWDCRFDPVKLDKTDASIILAWRDRGTTLSEWTPTNMQYFVTKHPPELFPFDRIDVPAITNPCANEAFRDGARGGLMELRVRCTGCMQILAANVVFAPATSDFSKPFITRSEIAPDGMLRLLTTPQEFEQSQK